MAVMEFLTQNYLNTSTVATATSNPSVTSFLYDRNTGLRYLTSGVTTSTSATIGVVFGTSRVISKIFIQNHNLRDFELRYNSVTTITAVTLNSGSSTYISFASVTASSVDLISTRATTTDTERTVGEFYVGDRHLQFDRNPTAKNYDPARPMKRVIHKMPDGGVTAFNIRQKFNAKIKLDFASDSLASLIQPIYDTAAAFYFLPYPTTTGWAGVAHECLWTNEWDFTYAENSKSQGQSGSIVLEETSNA